MTILDPRDVVRVEHGLLPIYTHEPRRLSAGEIADHLASLPPGERRRTTLLLARAVPMVHDGWLIWNTNR